VAVTGRPRRAGKEGGDPGRAKGGRRPAAGAGRLPRRGRDAAPTARRRWSMRDPGEGQRSRGRPPGSVNQACTHISSISTCLAVQFGPPCDKRAAGRWQAGSTRVCACARAPRRPAPGECGCSRGKRLSLATQPSDRLKTGPCHDGGRRQNTNTAAAAHAAYDMPANRCGFQGRSHSQSQMRRMLQRRKSASRRADAVGGRLRVAAAGAVPPCKLSGWLGRGVREGGRGGTDDKCREL
jgi:hypothetical protein